MATGVKPALVAAVASSVVTSLVVGGFVMASIPDAQGTIHGCLKKNGQLRVIDTASETCAGTETPLSWNQRGPAGPPGAPGPAGPAGPQGPSGPPGSGSGKHVIGGGDIPFQAGGTVDTPLAMYSGYMWTRLPIAGTVGDFTGQLVLPPSHQEKDRHRDGAYAFTVMCQSPRGSAASCNGLGPGPVDTPISCTISQADFASVPILQSAEPVCFDKSGATTFRFAAGEMISVRVRKTGDVDGGNFARWAASYTPL